MRDVYRATEPGVKTGFNHKLDERSLCTGHVTPQRSDHYGSPWTSRSPA
jgi:hypothetical protein